mgnify:CR=1 FL=1
MDKNAIKKYAVWARRELISRVSQRAAYFEITEAGFGDPAADSVLGRVLSAEEKTQRQALIAQIRQKGYQQVMEEVAYTWFNRFIALRFMEVNGYLPSHVRVFTDEANQFKPQILAEAIHMELDGLDMQKVYAFKNTNDEDGLFKYMVIVQCNALSAILPGMFQRISDYTELLFPDNLLRDGSVLQQMIEMIPEEDWKDAVQIIGWLYQYYNAEKKDEVFAALKKNVKITKENIPAATQLFTPDWIVRYMVENSLGRLWLEHLTATGEGYHYSYGEYNAATYINADKVKELKTNWKYYLEEAEQEPSVQVQLAEIRKEYAAMTPEQIKCIDPCCGSGHILAYLFDVLMQIYESYGYTTREAVASIVQNNLYGLDIDDRAAQLAYFAVMMKARQYDRRFFSRGIQPYVYAIKDSNGIGGAYQYEMGNFLLDKKHQETLNYILEAFRDAKEYGSTLQLEERDYIGLMEAWKYTASQTAENMNLTLWYSAVEKAVPELIQQAIVLSQKYDVVVTNPPYMGSSGMGVKLADFVKKNYPDSKSDLFAVFIEACGKMTRKNSYQAMITQHAWMFLSSFEKLRTKLLQKDTINMAHLGARAFDEIGGEVVQTTSFVLRNSHIAKYKGIYCRLIEPTSEWGKEKVFLSGEKRYITPQANFSKISGTPIAYWLSNKFIQILASKRTIGNTYRSGSGLSTADNNRFLRQFWEVDKTKIAASKDDEAKWFLFQKGGEYRKWYGNLSYVVNWENDGAEIKYWVTHNPKDPDTTSWSRRIFNTDLYFLTGITWSVISSGDISFRATDTNAMISNAAGGIFGFSNEQERNSLMAGLNTKIWRDIFSTINPTLNYSSGVIQKSPVPPPIENDIGRKCVELSKTDWDSFETSWDFKQHPLVRLRMAGAHAWGDKQPVMLLPSAYRAWKQECNGRFEKLKANEEELNRIFIDIYGLQDELTPEVADKDVTVHYLVDTKDDIPASLQGSNYVLTRRDVIVSLISYAVGCMFGRYSLDVEGLAYAGGDWNAVYRMQQEIYTVEGKEVHLADGRVLTVKPTGYNQIKTDDGWKNLSYPVDADNVIPICDDEYFDDDMVGRFVKFIETVYGSDTLEENLKFIADALGGKGTPRDVIRSYFLNDFYADHCKTYQKRPIYWLFDSGKKNGFKALIYMHRYQPDIIARIRTAYVHEQQSRYRTAIDDLESRIAAASTAERVKLNKQLKKLQEQDTELRTYEEKIHHLADQMISIDLDDGVKVNYAKFQDVLAKIK